MSPWSRKRLALCCGCVLSLGTTVVGSNALNAQNEKPATPQEAGTLFGSLLSANRSGSIVKANTISKQDYRLLGESGVQALLADLGKNAKPAKYTSAAPHNVDGVTLVNISPDAQASDLPVVVVSEDGGYRVNLIATYARAMNLGEGAYQQRVFELTHAAIPGLPNAGSPEVHDRVCRKNLTELHRALTSYVQSNQKFPHADSWTDSLKPHVSAENAFHCPASPEGKWGYAFNAKLSEKPVSLVKVPHLTHAIYETSELRSNAAGTGKNMAHRHQSTEAKPNLSHAVTVDGRINAAKSSRKPYFGLKAPIPPARH